MYGGSPIARYRSIEHIGASQKDANDAGRPNENAPHAMHSAMFGYSWKHPDEPPQCGRKPEPQPHPFLDPDEVLDPEEEV